jgi:hypothetical protein
MYEKGTRLSRAKIPPLITDSNQACFIKMIGRRVQEGVLRKGDVNNTYLQFSIGNVVEDC